MRAWIALWVLASLGGCDLVFTVRTPSDDAAGPSGGDEDGDAIDNATDNCPGIANTDQADGDQDGVGDLCDLHPDVKGDRIIDRFFFDDPSDLDRLTNVNWTAIPGALQASNGANLITRSLTDTSLTVEVGFRLLAEGNVFSTTGIAIDGAGGQRCAVTDNDGSDGGDHSQLYLEPAGTSALPPAPIIELAVGALHRMRFTREPPTTAVDVICQIDADTASLSYNQPTIFGEVVISSDQVMAEIDYVVFYGR